MMKKMCMREQLKCITGKKNENEMLERKWSVRREELKGEKKSVSQYKKKIKMFEVHQKHVYAELSR